MFDSEHPGGVEGSSLQRRPQSLSAASPNRGVGQRAASPLERDALRFHPVRDSACLRQKRGLPRRVELRHRVLSGVPVGMLSLDDDERKFRELRRRLAEADAPNACIIESQRDSAQHPTERSIRTLQHEQRTAPALNCH